MPSRVKFTLFQIQQLRGIANTYLHELLRQKLAGALTAIVVVAGLPLADAARAECVDINADPAERLNSIIHIDDERAGQIIEGRPWPGVRALTGIHGIGLGRIRDILDEGIACSGVRAPRGQRPKIEGMVVVLDADTFAVAGERVRLIGIDAPEGEQMCRTDGHDWPCGQIATAEVYRMVGGKSVTCDVYGRDRWKRALAECFQHGKSINAAIVRAGWALAWYPETGAVLGPRFDEQEQTAADERAGMWRGDFIEPWNWRRGAR